MTPIDRWLDGCGFDVWHVPGVSRCWRLQLSAGDSVLITDPGGYDLPEPGGPYLAICLTAGDDPLEGPTLLTETRQLVVWLRHVQRLVIYLQSAVPPI